MSSRTERLAWAFLIAGHAIAAFTSFGFHQPDEHFQILEWANHLVGLNPDASLLRWEHAAQIRPWFQPMLHAALLKPLLAAGLFDPFRHALLCRGLYALANLFALHSLWQFFRERYRLDPRLFLWISLLWFLPYLHVRTSSENLAGIFLSFALPVLLDGRKPLLAGLLLGFSFLARYQMALGVAGLGAALLWRDRKVTREHLQLGAGFALPVILGVLLDRIGYGEWVFSSWRYFKVNLLDGVAAQYHPRPWWHYFAVLFTLNPLTTLPIFAGALLFLKRARKNDALLAGAFLWSFFALHCFLTNKEYRFLFPVVNLAVFLAAVALQGRFPRLSSRNVTALWGLQNLVVFAISTLHGASLLDTGAVEIAGRNLDPSRPVLAQSDYRSRMPFYRFPEHSFQPLVAPSELASRIAATPGLQVLLDGRFEDPAERGLHETLLENKCVLLDSTYPLWLHRARARWAWAGSHPFIAWYRCP